LVRKELDNSLTRRGFVARSAAAGAVAAVLRPSQARAQVRAQVQNQAAAKATAGAQSANFPLDLAEWSYFWLGVERASLAKGTYVTGKQMYVEYMVPREVLHPYAIVMVHGGGGQGLDWMSTPDGRPGWADYFVRAGYRAYVVDRPGHGRSPFHPDLDGPFPARATTYEGVMRQFTAPEKVDKPYGDQAKLHTQWPGTGVIGDPSVDQVAAGQGGSFLADLEATHNIWKERLAELLDKTGPAIVMSHSMGGPNAWIAGEVRPQLVKGMIGVEPAGPPFGALRWGLAACKLTYDPAAADAREIKTVKVTPTTPGVDPYFIQAEPARQLVNLKNIPAAVFTSEASYHTAYDDGSVAYLKQAGVKVDHVKLPALGIHGNAHFMMMEKNNREVLQPILEWIETNVNKGATATIPRASETAIKTAGHGHFWVGIERRKLAYGTIVAGQMYVEHWTPADVKHPYPVVLVHGGTGQMLHYMGNGDGQAGWAHYYLQAGYRVYMVDRPGHGRAPYHPDALGPIGPQPSYEMIVPDFRRSANGPNRRPGGQWMGTGEIGDPGVDQFMASQNAAPQDNLMAHKLWASGGAELLDRIGPAIVQVHSAGGPFSWLVANERPKLVKAIVNVEGAGAPFSPQTPWGLTDIPLAFEPAVADPSEFATVEIAAKGGAPAYKLQAEGKVRKLKNLAGIPIAFVSAEKSGRAQGASVVAFLKQAGCDAEELQLKDRGISGNGHFMMIESNRKEVFDVIRGWVESKVPQA